MDKESHVNQILGEMAQTYKAKNTDYGSSFSDLYAEFGMTSPIIKLSDKLNRLKSLCPANSGLEKSPEVADESIEDTLIDLANYAVLTLAERRAVKGELTLHKWGYTCANGNTILICPACGKSHLVIKGKIKPFQCENCGGDL